MRDGRRPTRGEPARVAERTRELLAHFDHDPDAAGASEPTAPGAAGRWPHLLARMPLRLDPGRRAALAVGAAVLVAAVATGIWLLSAQPRAVSVSTSAPPSVAAMPALGSSGPGAASSTVAGSVSVSAPPDLVVVDVAGKVRRPGLYRLPPGSRVDDAVRAAGGALTGVDLSSLNLAAKVVDGQQILVGLAGIAPPPAGSSAATGGASSGTAGPVNLNSATLDQLETLPGVGPVLGQHILDWRSAHGSFQSVDQLNDVTGIGDVKFASLQPLVTV